MGGALQNFGKAADSHFTAWLRSCTLLVRQPPPGWLPAASWGDTHRIRRVESDGTAGLGPRGQLVRRAMRW
jgi:hypothetical protein